jgi:microcystin-dependent protein
MSAMSGEVRLFAGNFDHDPWMSCDGRSLPVGGALIQLGGTLGYKFGSDGTRFRIPTLASPAPGIRYIISPQGMFYVMDGNLGEITLFGGIEMPKNAAPCDGRLLPIAGNHPLFSLLGTTFGGNGTSNFALPKLPDRAPGVQYIICIKGSFPTRSTEFWPAGTMGEIRLFAGGFEPKEWSFCDGRSLILAQETALFSILGYTFGGDVNRTFRLPNLPDPFPGTKYIICTAGVYPRRPQ